MVNIGELMIISYIGMTAITVWAAARQKGTIYLITKPMLMLVLLGVYLTNSSSIGAGVIVALFFAWLGDVFLLEENTPSYLTLYNIKPNVIRGGISFAICHIVYIWIFYQTRNPFIEWQFYVIVILIYLVLGTLIYVRFWREFSGIARRTKLGIGTYLYVILMMSCSSTLIISPNQLFSYMPLVGSGFFMLSDYLLLFEYYTDLSCNLRPLIIASYATAQFLIISGLILLGV